MIRINVSTSAKCLHSTVFFPSYYHNIVIIEFCIEKFVVRSFIAFAVAVARGPTRRIAWNRFVGMNRYGEYRKTTFIVITHVHTSSSLLLLITYIFRISMSNASNFEILHMSLALYVCAPNRLSITNFMPWNAHKLCVICI